MSDDTLLTEEIVRGLGFDYIDLHDDPPYDMWRLHSIDIWEFNGLYWIVDMLDQAGVELHLTTVGQLRKFFDGCQQPLGG